MKLNLLPATVSRGAQLKTAVAISVVIALIGFGLAIALTLMSQANLAEARDEYIAQQRPAAEAVATAASANTLMTQPIVQDLVTNVALAEAMMKHNDAYPDLYNSLRPYIPPYYRLTQLQAAPLSDTQASVTMVGTLDTFQQYSDLMLSLMLNKEAVSVTRSGYTNDELIVPQLVTIDQNGRPRQAGQQPIPDDPLERLAFLENQSFPPDYENLSNYGSGTLAVRGPMPGESVVTVQVVLNRNIQTPNPQATITAGGGAAPVGGGAGPQAGVFPGAAGRGAAAGPGAGMPGGGR